ncbi:MAG: TonB-dependent receptor [Rhodocyclales bacterium GT-UBC]|nr:MAG: TonB-dependent receptor [Rhodocyclales bacterium GT-UBC]
MFPLTPINKQLSLIFALGLPFALQAAEDDPRLSEMVITATKTERSIKDISAAVTVIDKERIEKSGATTVDQLLQGVPGVYAARMDASSPNRIAQTYTRGLPGNGRTLVLVDGIPMNVLYDSQVDWSQLGTIDVERVEVVRGAGSALYGNHAMGGVINVISKTIAPGLHGRVEGDYGSLDTKRGAGLVSYRGERSGFALSASYLESDGYDMWRPDTSQTTIPLSQRAKTGTEKTNVGAKFFYEIDNSNLLDFNFSYLRDITTGLYNIPGYNAQDRQQYLGSGRYRHFGDNSETTIVLYSRIGQMDADSANAPNATSPDVTAAGVKGASRIAYRGDFDDRETGIHAQTSHRLGSHHNLTFGGEYADGEMTMTNRYPAEPGRVQVTKGNVTRSGVFLQDEISIDRFNVNLAGRWDNWKTSGSFHDTKASFPNQGSWSDRSETAFLPKAGASYRLLDDLILRGSIGKSFNAPDASQLYGNSRRGTVTAYGNPLLEPEKALSRDIGLDYYFGKTAYVKSTYYYTTAEDFISTIQRSGAPTGTTDKVNYDGVRARGFELEGRWRATEWVSLQGSYTKNDSVITKFAQNRSLEGKQLTNVPQHQAYLRADFSLPFGLTAFGVANYVGTRYSNEANTTTYKAYTTYDAGLSKTLTKDVSLRLTLINLGDKKYEGIGYIAPGFTVSSGLIAKF